MRTYTVAGYDASDLPTRTRYVCADESWGDGWEVSSILASVRAGYVGKVDTVETITSPEGTLYTIAGDMFRPPVTERLLDATHQKAQAYAWGRQDGGSEEHDSMAARLFANAYTTRQLAYGAGHVPFMPNLRSAYDAWRAGETF